MKKIYLSGITPSSSEGLHLGNYLGAIRQQVAFQDEGQCFYFIADYHALNTVHDPKEFENNVLETYLDYMALGIDLEKTTFYIESHIPAIFELANILRNVVSLAQMKRMHAYKDKLDNPDADVNTINMGLFTYPILMAADILAFRPDFIPVGEDQTQHVEISRDIAKAFNKRYGNVLKIPEVRIREDVQRVVGTDGERKMSKSLGNQISIFADEKTIKKQIMGITTDPNRIHKDDPGDPEKNPIFSYMRAMEYNQKKLKTHEEMYKKGSVGDTELKEEFYKFFMDYFSQMRDKRETLAKDKKVIIKQMQNQAVDANKVANEVLGDVRKAIGAVYQDSALS